MVKIGVCDDILTMAVTLKGIVDHYFDGRCIFYSIGVFTSGEQILEAAENCKFDIIFLDIDMPGLDGIDTGSRLRDICPECIIVMATGMENRIKEAFKIHAFRFVSKPYSDEEIYEALESAVSDMESEDTIKIFLNRRVYEIKQNSILYLCAYNGYTEIYLQDNKMRRDNSLKEMESELSKNIFSRINKTVIVNLSKIQHYKNDKIIVNDEEFTVSKRRKKEFETKYIEYDLKYGRL